MNDIKNISLAWMSALTSVCTAIEAKTVVTIVSAIVLPILFFAIGKTIDVLLQMHFRRQATAVRNGIGASTPADGEEERSK